MRGAALTLVASAALLQPVTAFTIPDILRSFENLQDVRKRCDNPCGYYSQVCCGSGETCYTDDNNEAACMAAGAGSGQAGSWVYTTATYVMTDLETITTTLSSFLAQATSSDCEYSKGETPCGNVCCAAGEFCESSANSRCKDTGSGSSGFYSSLYTVTTVITNTADAPYRPTSDTLVTVTATGTLGEITTTQGFIAPTSTIIAESQNGGGGGLSGGAIAGIVIGVLAAIIILILICLCCCAKGVLDAILGIFGLGPRKRRREEEVEVYESRHSRRGRSTSAAGKRTWFGTRPKRSSVVEEKKSGWGRGASVAAFLGGLALILGLKRRHDRKDDKSSVGYGSSYYSDYTSSECATTSSEMNAMLTQVQARRALLIEERGDRQGPGRGHIQHHEHQEDNDTYMAF